MARPTTEIPSMAPALQEAFRFDGRGVSSPAFPEYGARKSFGSVDVWDVDERTLLRVRTDRVGDTVVPGQGRADSIITAFHRENLLQMGIIANHVRVSPDKQVEIVDNVSVLPDVEVFVDQKGARHTSSPDLASIPEDWIKIAENIFEYGAFIHVKKGLRLESAVIPLGRGIGRNSEKPVLVGKLFTPDKAVIEGLNLDLPADDAMWDRYQSAGKLVGVFTGGVVIPSNNIALEACVRDYFAGSQIKWPSPLHEV